jgi:uncharacterized protein YjiK
MSRLGKGFLVVVVFIGALVASSLPVARPQLESPHDVGGGLPANFEPSGAAWQPRLKRLLVVGDQGLIASMDPDGGSVRTWSLPGDLEGIAVADPETDLVYVAVEQPAGIVEFDIAQGRVLRRFPLPHLEAAGRKHNKGLEALAFVPDASDPEGGAFWAGVQTDGTVHELSLPLRSDRTRTTVREIRTFAPVRGATDISGLDWDPATKTIWALFDKANEIVVLDRSGAVQATWTVPGAGQEGIALTPEWMFIADDSSNRVVRYERLKPSGESSGRPK